MTTTTVGLSASFAALAKVENEAAVDVLMAALESPRRAIQESALRALLARNSLTGQREILRRFGHFDGGLRAIVRENPGRLSHALRDALVGDDAALFASATEVIIRCTEYDQIPTLVLVAENQRSPHAASAAATLLELADALYQELAAPRESRRRRDPQLVRRHVIACLETSVSRYSKHKRPQILEAFLVLAGRDNALLLSILLDPHHSSYVALAQALSHSERPGVMRLVLSYLDDPHCPSSMMSVIAHRADRRFVEHLLRRIGHTPSTAARANLRHAESVAWARHEQPLPLQLDDAAQHSAVQLVLATNMPRAEQFRFVESMFRSGSASGRRAAISSLERFPGAEGNQLVMAAMEDADPQVRATAVRQLRMRGIPGALPLLLAQVDSPHHLVREAARESLTEFSFKRYIAAYDMLDDEVRRSTGVLVKRIDPLATTQLQEELTAASGKRRLRAIQAARSMQIVPQIEITLLQMIHDGDHLLRAEAALALGESDSPQARQALAEVGDDSSFTVQEAAAEALHRIAQRGAAPLDLPAQQPGPVVSWPPTFPTSGEPL